MHNPLYSDDRKGDYFVYNNYKNNKTMSVRLLIWNKIVIFVGRKI